MQITIENNITNILFYPATEIKLYHHQMRRVLVCGWEGNYKFWIAKMLCGFFFCRIFCRSIVEILNFIAYGWTWNIFRHSLSMISLLFLVAIIIFAYCYRIVYRNLCSFHPVLTPDIDQHSIHSAFFGPNITISTVNCRFSDFCDVSVTICWLQTWFCNFFVFSLFKWCESFFYSYKVSK